MTRSQEIMELVDDLLFNRVKFNHKRTTEENKIKLEQVYWHDKAKLQAIADSLDKLEADSKRYRFLRASGHFGGERSYDLRWYLPRYFGSDKSLAEQLDDCIDSQLKDK